MIILWWTLLSVLSLHRLVIAGKAQVLLITWSVALVHLMRRRATIVSQHTHQQGSQTASAKWNAAVIRVINYCVALALTRQNGIKASP